ncbi:hypothetical protein M758_3G188700 [Ceratodon purpureus]|nr:hypothetical protein M758_3G188700 [Ceratodon purpureus]
MGSVKQPQLAATSLLHILVAALLISQASLLLQPAYARVVNADRRLLAATHDKVTKVVIDKEVEIVVNKETEPVGKKETRTVANKETEMVATEDKPVGREYWGGGGGGHNYYPGHGGGGSGYYPGHGGGSGNWGGGGHGGGCCDDTENGKP